jgi:hypothetical protein
VQSQRADAIAAVERHEEALRMGERRRHAVHGVALAERFTHECEPAVLEIAQPAVQHVARAARCAGGDVALLEHGAAVAVPRRETRDAEPGDAAADDRDVVARAHALRSVTCTSVR